MSCQNFEEIKKNLELSKKIRKQMIKEYYSYCKINEKIINEKDLPI